MIDELIGQTIRAITVTIGYNDTATFLTKEGNTYIMKHYQDCCEYVRLEQTEGELQTIVGIPVITAEVVTNDKAKEGDDDGQWTFYRIGTKEGMVVLRWYGSSSGYYSIDVEFDKQ